MKKYVFFTPSIINMGGAQMYVRNKVVWLRKQGWNVQVISACKGNVIISELKEFDVFFSEMQLQVYLFSPNKQRKVIAQVIEYIQPKNFDEIVIESTCIGITTWAEVIAREIGAKHLSFLLQESNVVDNPQLQEYFKFKLKRRELASITDQSLKMMFESFSPIGLKQSYKLPAYCNNVVEDIDSPLLHNITWDKYDYKVGCLSRIDKSFIMPAITNFAEFARTHTGKRFLLLMIGGAPENTSFEGNIKKVFNEINNVELVITGYMFPIPTKLLECFDTFFASAGSCRPCARAGVPTISIDANDFMPIGVINHTTNNSLFRAENEPILNYQEVFEDVIIKKKYKRASAEHEISDPDFSEHIDFLKMTDEISEYFDLRSVVLTKSECRFKIALSLLGLSNSVKLRMLKRRLLNMRASDKRK